MVVLRHICDMQDKLAQSLLDLTVRGAEAVGTQSAADVWRSGMAMLIHADSKLGLEQSQQHPLQTLAQRFAGSMLGKQQGPAEVSHFLPRCESRI